MKLKKLLKRICCKHQWKIWHTGTTKINSETYVKTLLCEKCGKETRNEKLIKEAVIKHNARLKELFGDE